MGALRQKANAIPSRKRNAASIPREHVMAGLIAALPHRKLFGSTAAAYQNDGFFGRISFVALLGGEQIKPLAVMKATAAVVGGGEVLLMSNCSATLDRAARSIGAALRDAGAAEAVR